MKFRKIKNASIDQPLFNRFLEGEKQKAFEAITSLKGLPLPKVWL
jgi:hypothetical protein